VPDLTSSGLGEGSSSNEKSFQMRGELGVVPEGGVLDMNRRQFFVERGSIANGLDGEH
jgi:hypothetical protein